MENAPQFSRPFIHANPVDGIAPVDGWHLFEYDEQDSDRFVTKGYTARRGDTEVMLGLSRFGFIPTNERFRWLVRNNFPRSMQRPSGLFSPLDNRDIDAALAAERVAA